MTDVIERGFDKEVLENELPVFACFTARWCQSFWAACFFADQLAKEYESRVKFVKVNVEKIPLRQRMAEEETICEKVDVDGTRWTKVYFGGGGHFRNWLSQFIELKGKEI